MEYISIKEASIKWGISERRIQKLCSEDRIEEQFGSAGSGQYRKMQKTERCKKKVIGIRCD